VWEDANDRGLIAMEDVNGGCVVRVTPRGLELLQSKSGQSSIAPGSAAVVQ
jgi:hypothetical protein